jgi:transposase
MIFLTWLRCLRVADGAHQLVQALRVIKNPPTQATAKLDATEPAVAATGSGLPDLSGIGPVGAAGILGDVGDVARFQSKARFASWTGTAPLDASSGQQQRHRLSRAGNRRINHVLYIAAFAQMRHDTAGRA